MGILQDLAFWICFTVALITFTKILKNLNEVSVEESPRLVMSQITSLFRPKPDFNVCVRSLYT